MNHFTFGEVSNGNRSDNLHRGWQNGPKCDKMLWQRYPHTWPISVTVIFGHFGNLCFIIFVLYQSNCSTLWLIIYESTFLSQLSNFSGYINLRKVKWDAKHEYDFVHNFKVLQATFKLLAVDKVWNIPYRASYRTVIHRNNPFVL